MTSSRDGYSTIGRSQFTNQNKIQPFPNYNSSKDTNKKIVTIDVNRSDKDFKYVSASLANKFNRTNDKVVDEDTLALKFMPLDPFTGNVLRTLKFLGYITDYTENYDSSWGDVKYAGRNEKFYIFNDFKRTANVSFNIPCFNPKELEQKHCDMSELASVLAGKYQDNLLLGGIITKLKVGNYINDQPGIITNLNFSPIEGSSWDLDAGLAFYLKVTFGFTLIHNFLPQYGKCGFIDREPDPVPPPPPPPPPPTPPPPPSPLPKPPIVKPPETIPPTYKDKANYIFPGEAGVLQGQKNKVPALTNKDVKPFTKAQDDALTAFLKKSSRP
jgi:hypothetical protein